MRQLLVVACQCGLTRREAGELGGPFGRGRPAIFYDRPLSTSREPVSWEAMRV